MSDQNEQPELDLDKAAETRRRTQDKLHLQSVTEREGILAEKEKALEDEAKRKESELQVKADADQAQVARMKAEMLASVQEAKQQASEDIFKRQEELERLRSEFKTVNVQIPVTQQMIQASAEVGVRPIYEQVVATINANGGLSPAAILAVDLVRDSLLSMYRQKFDIDTPDQPVEEFVPVEDPEAE